MSAQTIKVIPIYGWGWVVAGKPRFEIPKPFTLRLEEREPKHWTGIVLDRGHEFEGQRVAMSQRHVDWTGDVNIWVKSNDDESTQSTGFGMLAESP